MITRNVTFRDHHARITELTEGRTTPVKKVEFLDGPDGEATAWTQYPLDMSDEDALTDLCNKALEPEIED